MQAKRYKQVYQPFTVTLVTAGGGNGHSLQTAEFATILLNKQHLDYLIGNRTTSFYYPIFRPSGTISTCEFYF